MPGPKKHETIRYVSSSVCENIEYNYPKEYMTLRKNVPSPCQIGIQELLSSGIIQIRLPKI